MRKVGCVIIVALVAAILLPATGAVAGLPHSVHVSVTDVYRTLNSRGTVATLNGKAWFENSGGHARSLVCTFQGSAGRDLNWANSEIRVKVPAHTTVMANVVMKGPVVTQADAFTMWKDQCTKI